MSVRHRLGYALAVLAAVAALGVPAWAAFAPIDADSREAVFEIPKGTFARVDADGDSHYYADSTCPTCRITLLSVGRNGANRWHRRDRGTGRQLLLDVHHQLAEELERVGAYRVYADPADLLARADEVGVRGLAPRA